MHAGRPTQWIRRAMSTQPPNGGDRARLQVFGTYSSSSQCTTRGRPLKLFGSYKPLFGTLPCMGGELSCTVKDQGLGVLSFHRFSFWLASGRRNVHKRNI